jgi:hypothetical protein
LAGLFFRWCYGCEGGWKIPGQGCAARKSIYRCLIFVGRRNLGLRGFFLIQPSLEFFRKGWKGFFTLEAWWLSLRLYGIVVEWLWRLADGHSLRGRPGSLLSFFVRESKKDFFVVGLRRSVCKF